MTEALTRAGFDVPANFDEAPHQEQHEWRMAAECPDELLRANAHLRPVIHPALPSLENIGHIIAYHKRHRLKTPLIYLMASYGFLPLMNDKGASLWGHPWLHHEGSRLALDVADRQHVCAFVLWKISVLSDLSTDRQTPIVKAHNRRIVN